jgi:ankyrin repeat protein
MIGGGSAEPSPIIIELGADIHSADNSGLTPYQVAISEGNKSIFDFEEA